MEPPFRAAQTLLIYRNWLTNNAGEKLHISFVDQMLVKTFFQAYIPDLLYEKNKAEKQGTTYSVWELIHTIPQSEIATLISWDAWLSSDMDEQNTVIRLLGKELNKNFSTSAHLQSTASSDAPTPSEYHDSISHLPQLYLNLLDNLLRKIEKDQPTDKKYNQRWLAIQTQKAETLSKQSKKKQQQEHQRFMQEIDALLIHEYGKEGEPLVQASRFQHCSNLPYVKQGLVHGKKLLEAVENKLYERTIDCFLPRKSLRYPHHVRQFDDQRLDSGDFQRWADRPARPDKSHYPPPPRYLSAGKTIRGDLKGNQIMEDLNHYVYTFHHASGVCLTDCKAFQEHIRQLDDYKTMIVVKARMDLEKVPEEFYSAWVLRMKDVLMEHYAQIYIQKYNAFLHEGNQEFVGVKRPDYDGQGRSNHTAFKMAKQFIHPEGSRTLTPLFAVRDEPTKSHPLSWERLFIKPPGWPDDFNKVLEDLIPSPEKLIEYLKTNHYLSDS